MVVGLLSKTINVGSKESLPETLPMNLRSPAFLLGLESLAFLLGLESLAFKSIGEGSSGELSLWIGSESIPLMSNVRGRSVCELVTAGFVRGFFV